MSLPGSTSVKKQAPNDTTLGTTGPICVPPPVASRLPIAFFGMTLLSVIWRFRPPTASLALGGLKPGAVALHD